MPQSPPPAELEDATWIALDDITTGALDRLDSDDGEACDVPLRSVIHVTTTIQLQGAIGCYAGEIDGVLQSSVTTVKTQQWWTDIIPPATEATLISEITWTNTHSVDDDYHLTKDEDGATISPDPECTYSDTAPDEPEGWDVTPDGYNGTGQPLAFLVEPDDDVSGTTSIITSPSVLRSYAVGALGAGYVQESRYFAIYNRRGIRVTQDGNGMIPWQQSPAARTDVGISLIVINASPNFYGASVTKRTLVIKVLGHRIPCFFSWRIGIYDEDESTVDAVWSDYSQVCSHSEGWEVEIVMEPAVGTQMELADFSVAPLF